MPSLVPKTNYQPRQMPECVCLEELFSDERYQGSLDRVVNYLHNVQANYSDGSFERVSRPGVVTEQFFFAMPTEDAYTAEIELVNAIQKHALGNINDESIKVYLQKYLDTHTFVYRDVAGTVKQEFKTGYSRRTGRDVPLFMVEHQRRGNGKVLNDVQLQIYLKMQERSGNGDQCRVEQL